ncbi:glycerol-3-phosphate dehydrogenase [Bacillus coahuilensis p1.1.43]|uniref:Glycerol-3-phosphate dehydrogenase n=1 Tax=Bacillus coahuilensis p1.1.43 TaxID=1150625 RepID=A0A147K963_9BACI|nr:glycerol-3-phosphate dehydrogenase/oxidase [Bacillus coahuilensis]KUP06807.1 glycerol-3-phosphate dehydrogenase [Bacillus coahuilensis p1.1.43]
MMSSKNRNILLNQMSQNEFDVVVVGGGITGAGIALDASSRGLKVALVEMQDFASGTSSRSTKLVHGGLRYLKQLEVKMVADVGKERAIVYENGPHVTTPEWMLLPIYKGGTFGKFSTSLGLRVYDFLAGVKKSERRSMLSKTETLKKEPLVKQENLLGGGYYVEYRTDDARLTMEVLKSAVSYGATVLNYVKANEFSYHTNRVNGIHATDLVSDTPFSIKGKYVINATGPWVDEVRKKDYSTNNKNLRLTKGVHLVFDQSVFPLKQAIYFDTPDGRMVFAIPRDGKTYVGTTDTFYNSEKATPKMTNEDREYILESIRFMFPEVNVHEEDVESSWAGIRPLIYEEGKDPSEISRKDEIWEHESGLITIAGGKLTGYRKMAEQVVDLVVSRMKLNEGIIYSASNTKNIRISGGDVNGSNGFQKYIEKIVNECKNEYLEKKTNRGINQNVWFQHSTCTLFYKYLLHIPVDYYAQLMYSIEHEMAYTPTDFFVRRTGDLYFNIEKVLLYKDQVITIMSQELNWTIDETKRYTQDLERELTDATEPINLH